MRGCGVFIPVLVSFNSFYTLVFAFSVKGVTSFVCAFKDCKDCALDTKSQKPPTLSKLDDEERKALFWYAVAFNFERSFSVSAIEVATTMISQREFGMTPITTGYIFGLITVGAVLLNLLVGCTPSYIPTRRSTCSV